MLKMQQGKAHKIIQQEVMKMALSNIFGWNKEDEKQAGTACGAAWGASDITKHLQLPTIYDMISVLYRFVIGQTFLRTTVIVYYNNYGSFLYVMKWRTRI